MKAGLSRPDARLQLRRAMGAAHAGDLKRGIPLPLKRQRSSLRMRLRLFGKRWRRRPPNGGLLHLSVMPS